MFLIFRDKYALIGGLAWRDILKIPLYDLWLLTLWRVISELPKVVFNGAFLYLNIL